MRRTSYGFDAVRENVIYVTSNKNSLPEKLYNSMRHEFYLKDKDKSISISSDSIGNKRNAFSAIDICNSKPHNNFSHRHNKNNRYSPNPDSESRTSNIILSNETSQNNEDIVKYDDEHSKVASTPKANTPVVVTNTENANSENAQNTTETTPITKTIQQPEDDKHKAGKSIATEESVGYFASMHPTQPKVENQKAEITTDINTNDIKISKVAEKEKLTDPSHHYNDNSPAVLPKFIIRRIVKTMHNCAEGIHDCPSTKYYHLDNFISKHTSDPRIRQLHWNDAAQSGEEMIEEIIELVLSANVEKNDHDLAVILNLIDQLESELLKTSEYILGLTPKEKDIDIITLKLLIYIIMNDLAFLKKNAQDWFKSDRSMNIGEYFRETLKESHELKNADIVNLFETAANAHIDKDPIHTDTAIKTSVLHQTTDKMEGVKQNAAVLSHHQPMEMDEVSAPKKIKLSVITTSRMKKAMDTIRDSAIRNNLNKPVLRKQSRESLMPILEINNQLVLQKTENQSLITKIKTLDKAWEVPIEHGKQNVLDLLEFIINSAAQDEEMNPILYKQIVEELNQFKEELLLSIAVELKACRIENKDFDSFCYEILAETIMEQIRIAQYMFSTLTAENKDINSAMLGKLFKTFLEESEIKEATVSRHSDPVAHLTVEVKNYSVDENVPLKSVPVKNVIQSGSSDKMDMTSNEILNMIIKMLEKQGNDIQDVKHSIQALKGIVEQKFSSFTCKFNPDQYDVTLKKVPDSVPHAHGVDKENAAYPIDLNRTSQLWPKSPGTGENTAANKSDILNLIIDGSHQLLTSKQQNAEKIEKKDSCQELNNELQSIFEWVLDKYNIVTKNGKDGPGSSTDPKEKFNNERNLMKRIVEENDQTIQQLVRDICFKRVIKCLSDL